MSTSGPRRIAVLRAGALGDFIVTLPALAWLRRRFPQAHLTVYGNRAALEIVAGRGIVDRGLSFDLAVPPELFVPLGPRAGPWVAEWQAYDLCIVWLRDHATVAENLLGLTKAAVLAAAPLPEPERGIHVTDHCLSTLAPLGLRLSQLTERERRPAIHLAEEELLSGRAWLCRQPALVGEGRRCIAVHAGSGGAWKCWPAARYAALCRQLWKEFGAATLLVEGPADVQQVEEVWRDLLAHGQGVPVVRATGLSLVQLAGVLSCCDAYVGNDSGVTHLAAALGVPVVAIFGPTDPRMWAPRGACVSVLWTGHDIAGVTVEDVLEAVARWIKRGQAGS